MYERQWGDYKGENAEKGDWSVWCYALLEGPIHSWGYPVQGGIGLRCYKLLGIDGRGPLSILRVPKVLQGHDVKH